MIRGPSVFFVAAIWTAVSVGSFVGCSSSRPDVISKAPAALPNPVPGADDGIVGGAPARGGAPPRVDSALVAPRSPAALAGGATGVGGAAGIDGAAAPAAGPVAVVILMLPKIGDEPDRPTAPRTYKLLLTADARTATIEVDGQAIGSAPVQRVYPGAGPPRVAARAAQPPRNLAPRRLTVAGQPSVEAPRTGPAPGFDRDGMEVPVHSSTFNPNGAPIID